MTNSTLENEQAYVSNKANNFFCVFIRAPMVPSFQFQKNSIFFFFFAKFMSLANTLISFICKLFFYTVYLKNLKRNSLIRRKINFIGQFKIFL